MLRLRELAAILFLAAMVVGLAFFYRWDYGTPPERDERLDGQILGFHGSLREGEFRHVVRARVRLPDGRIANVEWPRSGRASHCRQGDRVRLIRHGVRFRVYRDGCSPGLNPPSSAPASPPAPPDGPSAPALESRSRRAH